MTVTTSIQERALLISIDNPPVNALSHAVRKGLIAAMELAQKGSEQGDIDLVIITGAGSIFIAGADIAEFNGPQQEPTLLDTVAVIEGSSRPVIAAINGVALGGGLEIALGCHYRVALRQAKIALPEVHLGLIPGAGGTQRLPRLAGVSRAVEMITSGERIEALQALSFGILDHVVESDLVSAAIDFGRERPVRRTGSLPVQMGSGHAQTEMASGHAQAQIEAGQEQGGKGDGDRGNQRDGDKGGKGEWAAWGNHNWEQLESMTRERAGGREAPLYALQSIRNCLQMDFQEGLVAETEIFERCRQSDQSRALRYAFFAEREVSRPPGLDRSVKALPIEKVGIVGAGRMGREIALCFVRSGIAAAIVEANEERLAAGLGFCGGPGPLLQGSCSLADLAEADLVIEATFEDMNTKRDIFSRLDQICGNRTIMATTTSALDIDAIAAATRGSRQALGLHFCSPARSMKLIGVVEGSASSPQAIRSAMGLAKRLGKVAVLTKNDNGFIGSRILAKCLEQAHSLIREEGALPSEIDSAMQQFGFARGIFQMQELAGPQELEHLKRAYWEESRDRAKEREDEAKEREDGAADGTDMDQARSRDNQGRIGAEELLERIIYLMANESARMLERGIVQRRVDADQLHIHGYGYPGHRGGPLYFAEQVGLKVVIGEMQRWQEQTGQADWRPAAILQQAAQQGCALGDLGF